MKEMLTAPKFKKFSFFGILLTAVLLSFSFAFSTANAQTIASPIFLITWKTSGSYIPSFYKGKGLPSYGSRITASLELIANGKVVNVSDQAIYWYLDDVLIGGGIGVQQVTFSPFGTPPNSPTLSVKLPQYANGGIAHAVQIPLVDPVAIIYAPYPDEVFSINPALVNALPYFFNAKSATDLAFSWSVNGQAGTNTENPQEAEITIPQGTPNDTALNISLIIKNPVGSTIATANQNLTYQSKL